MTELIELVQKHDPGSELISLFELTFNSTTLYFHPGLDEGLDELYFEDATSPFKIREYQAFPVEMTGVEYNADGATNRPTLTIANVTSAFSNLLGGLSNKDLIGATVVVRQTLNKYLESEATYNNGGAAYSVGTTPIEFPKKKFILDRISGESSVAITFEVSSPYDLQGIQIPNRQVIGKYCSWVYQGNANGKGGGCTWKADSTIEYPNTAGAMISHKAYYDLDDNPLVNDNAGQSQLSATISAGWTDARGYVTYSNSVAMVKDSLYEHSNSVWKALIPQATTGANQIAPQPNSTYWKRAEVCGKKLSSCKCRFQFTPQAKGTTNSYPSTSKNTYEALPFGAFPGTKKFR